MKSALGLALFASVGVVACGSSTKDVSPSGASPATATAADTFDPPAPPDGYTRITAPVIKDLEPGADAIYCQYVQGPAERDMDILDVSGYQSKFGHHVIAYATTVAAPIGTSRLCTGEDNFSSGFLGGTGGDAGGAVVNLPAGVAFRLAKGKSIMLNTHFLNVGEETVDGQSVLDFRMVETDPTRTIASLFVNLSMGFDVPPRASSTSDASCVVPHDVKFVLFTNHMHSYGATATTSLVHGDGKTDVVRDDAKWTADEQFNPNFTKWDPASPLLVKAGETLRTHCEWDNSTDKDLKFPDEMCIGFGFFLANGADVKSPTCADGKWTE